MVTYIWSHSFPSPTSSQIPPPYPSYFIFFSLLKIYKTKTNKAQEEKKENKIEQNKTWILFCIGQLFLSMQPAWDVVNSLIK